MEKYLKRSKELKAKACYTQAHANTLTNVLLKISFVLVVILMASVCTRAQTTNSKPLVNVNDKGVILDGYDAVAFFTDNKPVKGDAQYQFSYEGANYYFASQAHLDLFKANPNKYKPQYGGWCAYAMGAKGEKVEVDPETFKIVDGKLYLFYNKYFNNTLKSWNKDETHLKANADKSWMKFIK